MRQISIAAIASAIAAQVLIFPASPASAISVELAKKCRAVAIKAHPPQTAGTKSYAAAERDFFNRCISANGEMNDDNNGHPSQDTR